MTREEKIICKHFLADADKTHSCTEYKLLMDLLEQEPTTKNDLPSELEKNSKKLEKDFGELDCISRVELLKAMDTWDKFGYTTRYGLERLDKDDKGFVPYVHYEDMVKCVKGMPSVTPQEPKTGHWIEHEWKEMREKGYYRCSVCNHGYQRYAKGIRKSDVPYRSR